MNFHSSLIDLIIVQFTDVTIKLEFQIYYQHFETVEGDLQVRNDPEIKRVQVPQINLCTVYSKAYD